jgi:hypothetical protein
MHPLGEFEGDAKPALRTLVFVGSMTSFVFHFRRGDGHGGLAGDVTGLAGKVIPRVPPVTVWVKLVCPWLMGTPLIVLGIVRYMTQI